SRASISSIRRSLSITSSCRPCPAFRSRPIRGTRSPELERRSVSEDQRAVDAAESEIVAHQVADLDLPPPAHQIVKIGASLIDILEIDCRREPALAHHLDAKPRLDRAAGAK